MNRDRMRLTSPFSLGAITLALTLTFAGCAGKRKKPEAEKKKPSCASYFPAIRQALASDPTYFNRGNWRESCKVYPLHAHTQHTPTVPEYLTELTISNVGLECLTGDVVIADFVATAYPRGAKKTARKTDPKRAKSWHVKTSIDLTLGTSRDQLLFSLDHDSSITCLMPFDPVKKYPTLDWRQVRARAKSGKLRKGLRPDEVKLVEGYPTEIVKTPKGEDWNYRYRGLFISFEKGRLKSFRREKYGEAPSPVTPGPSLSAPTGAGAPTGADASTGASAPAGAKPAI